jgi:hypothetical protein
VRQVLAALVGVEAQRSVRQAGSVIGCVRSSKLSRVMNTRRRRNC